MSARQQLLELASALVAQGLNEGTSGNCSVRLDAEHFLITPTGMEPHEMSPGDLVHMDVAGEVHSPRAPSSEWRFHRDLYAERPDVNVVIHTHSPYSTTLACLRRGIPAFHYMVAVAGGPDIHCAPYATYGTPLLSEYALHALEDRKACLLAHHGLLVVGSDLRDALKRTVEVETLAQMYWQVLQVDPDPPLLSPEEMERVLNKFAGYGQPKDHHTEA